MNLFLQIFLILTWLTSFANATPPIQKNAIPNYSVSFPTTENQKLDSDVKIGVQNFARRCISLKSGLQSEKSHSLKATSSESYALFVASRAGECKVVQGAGEVVRGIDKSQFIETVGDFANGANAQLADQAWTLWKNENWVELENFFNANNLNKYNGLSFPPNNGAVNVIKKTLDPADFNGNLVIDRYGATTGKFTAPANTPFPERALPSSYASQIPQNIK